MKRGKVPRKNTGDGSFWKRTSSTTCIKLDKGFDSVRYFEKVVWDAEKLASPKEKKPHCESMKDQQSISK